MGSTFLSLTNSVLRHFGEVELTSTTFSTATGFHAVAKDAVRDAIRVIQQAEYEWPFNHQISSFTLTASTATLGHTQLYALPTGTFSVESVDWESFVLKRNTSLDPEVKERKIGSIDYDTWLRKFRAGDKNIDTDSTDIREPTSVFREQTGGKIGVTPPPDRAYHLLYEWWGYETDLSAYTDTTSVPARFDHIIRQGAFVRCYQHREDIANYNISNKRFQEGIAKMRELLINQYKILDDNRVKG